MKRFNKRIPAFLMVMLVVLALTVPALAASASDAAPTAATTETEQTQQDNAAGSKSLAAGIAIGLAAAGGAIAMGVAVGKSTEGIARQPEADGNHLRVVGGHSDYLRAVRRVGNHEYPFEY